MALYRETVERRCSNVILMLSIILAINIFLSDAIERHVAQVEYVKVLQFTLTGAMCFIVLFELRKLKVKYKYTIIAHELIIHKIVGNEEIELEKIDVTTIQKIDKCCGVESLINSKLNCRRYLASNFNCNKHCCVYKIGNKVKKFYFAPSDKLMNKLNKYKVA